MLIEQTVEKLTGMRLHGMAHALRQWQEGSHDTQVDIDDLIGMMADAEWVHRENKKLSSRLRKARFKFASACIEDIIYKPGRGISKNTVMELASSRWVATHKVVILTGPTGAGKTWLTCALGQKACRDGYGVLYKRTHRLFDELAGARADGSYALFLRRLSKVPVLILDDFCMQPLTASERRDLVEILEDRYGLGATVIASQLEPNQWHEAIGDDTAADSICDRLVHGAHRIKLGGDSLRKVLADQEGGSGQKTKKPLTKGKRSASKR